MRSAWNSPWPPGPGRAVRRLLAPAQRDDEDGAEDRDQHRDQGQVVEPERARDEILLLAHLPDREARRRAVGQEARGGDERALAAAHQPDQEHEDQPAGQRDDRRQAGVVDVGGGERRRGSWACHHLVRRAPAATAPTLSWTDASPRFRISVG